MSGDGKHYMGELHLSNGRSLNFTCYESVGRRVIVEIEGPNRYRKSIGVYALASGRKSPSSKSQASSASRRSSKRAKSRNKSGQRMVVRPVSSRVAKGCVEK